MDILLSIASYLGILTSFLITIVFFAMTKIGSLISTYIGFGIISHAIAEEHIFSSRFLSKAYIHISIPGALGAILCVLSIFLDVSSINYNGLLQHTQLVYFW